MDNIGEILCKINGVLWGDFYIILISVGFVYLTVKSGFVQLRLGKIMKDFASAAADKSKRKAVSTALAASMGTGNIIGTAAALGAGGEGAVFWMAATSILGMSAAYSENYLGALYRKRDKSVSVPMGYIRDIPAGKILSVVYAVSCVLAAFFTGNMIQGNAACTAAASFFETDVKIPAVLFALGGAAVISGGRERIKDYSAKVIPAVSVIYLLFCTVGIILNAGNIVSALYRIFSSAFSFRAVSGGVLGTAVSTGLRRGIFSNEAGMGSSVLVHAEAGSADPKETGNWAAFEVFFDTVICCGLTALFIITSGAECGESGAYEAFTRTFGAAGETFIAFSLMIFAVSSVLGWCCYGETALTYLCADKKIISAYRAFQTICLFLGGISEIRILWQLADICDFLMLTVNMAAVVIGMTFICEKREG